VLFSALQEKASILEHLSAKEWCTLGVEEKGFNNNVAFCDINRSQIWRLGKNGRGAEPVADAGKGDTVHKRREAVKR